MDWDFIFQLIQSIGIIVSFLVTIYTLRINSKQTKATNSLLITQHHREIWTTIYQTETLKRVFDKQVDLITTPITDEELAFTNMIYLHMSACLKLSNTKSCYKIEGMEEDIKDILTFPIPKQIWIDVYKFHDKQFVDFVNRSCI